MLIKHKDVPTRSVRNIWLFQVQAVPDLMIFQRYKGGRAICSLGF